MSGLAGLLAGHDRPGVYRWVSGLEVDEVAEAVHTAGWRSAHLDGWTVPATKVDVLAALGEALGLPEHYGHNFDALHDCLRDIGAATPGVVLLWDGWATLARADRRTFDVLTDILGERAASGPSAFAVLLRGEGPDVPEIPLLD